MRKINETKINLEKAEILKTILETEYPINAKTITEKVYSYIDNNSYKKTLRLLNTIEEKHPHLFSIISTTKKSKENYYQIKLDNIYFDNSNINDSKEKRLIFTLLNSEPNNKKEEILNKNIKLIEFALNHSYLINLKQKNSNELISLIPLHYLKKENVLLYINELDDFKDNTQNKSKIEALHLDSLYKNLEIGSKNNFDAFKNFISEEIISSECDNSFNISTQLNYNIFNTKEMLDFKSDFNDSKKEIIDKYIKTYKLYNHEIECFLNIDSFNNILIDKKCKPFKIELILKNKDSLQIFNSKYPKSKFNYDLIDSNNDIIIRLELFKTKKLLSFFLDKLYNGENNITVNNKTPFDDKIWVV